MLLAPRTCRASVLRSVTPVAHAVIERSGDHCCEYMTGRLGPVCSGRLAITFGAGMTGRFAFVLDQGQQLLRPSLNQQ